MPSWAFPRQSVNLYIHGKPYDWNLVGMKVKKMTTGVLTCLRLVLVARRSSVFGHPKSFASQVEQCGVSKTLVSFISLISDQILICWRAKQKVVLGPQRVLSFQRLVQQSRKANSGYLRVFGIPVGMEQNNIIGGSLRQGSSVPSCLRWLCRVAPD